MNGSAYPQSGLNKQKGSAVPSSGMKTGMRQSHSESALIREESGSVSGGLRKAQSDPLNEEDEMENEINELVIEFMICFWSVKFGGIGSLTFAKIIFGSICESLSRCQSKYIFSTKSCFWIINKT